MNQMLKGAFLTIVGVVLIIAAVFYLPLYRVNWGRFSMLPAATITVTGQSQGSVQNQIASYNATVTSINADKQKATDETNTKMTALIKSVKDFGIPETDIKTENISVSQIPDVQTMIYPPRPSNANAGDWQATNSISITLKDVTKASALSDLLNKSGATNIYGPTFTVDTSTTSDADLLAKAVVDAKTKAQSIATASGVTLGRVINVQENEANRIYPLAQTAKDAGSSATPVQPGTSTLYKTVTVVFERK